MGAILRKFRKAKSTQEVLENLQDKIDALENFTLDTQEQKKRVVGNFLAVSIGVYIVAFVIFYLMFFPPTWQERIINSIPLFIFPIVIILLRSLFTWYFQRKLNKNSKKLTVLRAEKKKILEKVMDTETYKVAVNLLAKFADKPHSRSNYATPANKLNRSLPATYTSPYARTNQLALTSTPQAANRATAAAAATSSSAKINATSSNTPMRSQALLALQQSPSTSQQLLRRRTPFPIIDQNQKGVFDRIVDVLIGDGPQDRFAMICKECYSHNGMASKEDFEYMTFRCAFCNSLNPARKSRPAAPRLSAMPNALAAAAATVRDSDSSESSSDEQNDSDNERSSHKPVDITQFTTPPQKVAAGTPSSSSDEDVTQKVTKIDNEREDEDKQAAATTSHETKPKDTETKSEKSDSAIEDTTMSPEL